MKLFFAFVLSCMSALLFAQQPALQGQFKLHQVAPGETFFGIARMHQIHVSELKSANPEINADSIKIGQTLHIPVKVVPSDAGTPAVNTAGRQGQYNPNPFDSSRPAMNTTAPAVPPKAVMQTASSAKAEDGIIYHTVEEKQTLYAISRLYQVTVDEIAAWNQLPDLQVKAGMQLMIRKSKSAPAATPASAIAEPNLNAETVAPVKQSSYAPQNALQEQLYANFLDAKAKAGENMQQQRATISWLKSENEKMSSGYFALHKNAPVGTIIKVTNLVSKKFVFVKVIGKLPETADNVNVQMRMSPQARTDLSLGGEKGYVELEYYPK